MYPEHPCLRVGNESTMSHPSACWRLCVCTSSWSRWWYQECIMIVVVVVGSIVVAGGPFTKRQNRLNDWLHGSCGFTDVFSYQARPCASLRGGGHELAGRLWDCDDGMARRWWWWVEIRSYPLLTAWYSVLSTITIPSFNIHFLNKLHLTKIGYIIKCIIQSVCVTHISTNRHFKPTHTILNIIPVIQLQYILLYCLENENYLKCKEIKIHNQINDIVMNFVLFTSYNVI